jgi:hypothetical protein
VRERSHPNDRLAPLLYVSPTQINYLVESSDDYVSVSIERIGSPFVVHAMSVPTYPDGLVPGLFTLSPGLAAATTVRVGSDGNQTPAPVTTCNGSTCNSVPIDLSAGTVYLQCGLQHMRGGRTEPPGAICWAAEADAGTRSDQCDPAREFGGRW